MCSPLCCWLIDGPGFGISTFLTLIVHLVFRTGWSSTRFRSPGESTANGSYAIPACDTAFIKEIAITISHPSPSLKLSENNCKALIIVQAGEWYSNRFTFISLVYRVFPCLHAIDIRISSSPDLSSSFLPFCVAPVDIPGANRIFQPILHNSNKLTPQSVFARQGALVSSHCRLGQ